MTLATAGAFAAATFYACYARHQVQDIEVANIQNQKNFAAIRRAAVQVGLPNGSIAEFEESLPEIRLHLRNYGVSTAENTVVEGWAMTAPDRGTSQKWFPRFQGFDPAKRTITGVSVPPGFPLTLYVDYPGDQRKSIEAGNSGLKIVGRISYTDAFGVYCEPFTIRYKPEPFKNFYFGAKPTEDFCDPSKKFFDAFTWFKFSGPGTYRAAPYQILPPPPEAP